MNNLEIIRPDESGVNIEKDKEPIEESKTMNIDDLLEYIGDPSSNKGKKQVKAKGKKKEAEIKSPKNKITKKKNTSNSDKEKKEKQKERTHSIKNNPEDDNLIETFRSSLLLTSAHNAFVAKEEPTNLSEWINSYNKI